MKMRMKTKMKMEIRIKMKIETLKLLKPLICPLPLHGKYNFDFLADFFTNFYSAPYDSTVAVNKSKCMCVCMVCEF